MKIQDHQVLQRGSDGKARVELEDGSTQGLAAGGPYTVGGAQNVLVGDLWVLAGQSNMEGCGKRVDMEESVPLVHSLQSCEQWALAEEPLHWLSESPRLVHHKILGRDAVPDPPEPRDPDRDWGAGLGLTFAKRRLADTGVPVGLIPAAHGGTSMQQWSPDLKHEGGGSLYGATLERVRLVGGSATGILWYQGESDCNPADAARYDERMTHLVESFRSDLGRPDLPFYLVQLGRWIADPAQDSIDGWNTIRELQRTWSAKTPHTAFTSAIDLALDDGIHIGTAGQKRLGARLAGLAAGRPSLDLDRVSRSPDGRQIIVSFRSVRGGLMAAGRPAGFSLRHPDGREYVSIFKTTLEGDDVILHIENPVLPDGVSLCYGYGVDPYCNVTDASDAPVPAFGPVGMV